MAFRQGRSTQATTDPTNLAFSSAVLSGSLLVCTLQTPNTASVTVSDSVNGSWTSAINHSTTNTANDSAIFFFAGSAAGTPTVTVSGQGSGSPIGFCIAEFTGVLTSGALDKTGATEATAQTSITSGSVTNTGTNGDLNVSVLASNTQNVTYSNSTSGWSVDVNNTPNATMSASLADATQIPAAAFTTTWSVSGSAQDLSVLVASFKLAPPTGGITLTGIPPTRAHPIKVPGGELKPFNPDPNIVAAPSFTTPPYTGFGPIGLQKPPKFALSFFRPFIPPPTPTTAAAPSQPIFIFGVARKPQRFPREQFGVAKAPGPAGTPIVLDSSQKPRLRLRRGSAVVAGAGPLAATPTSLFSPQKPRLRLKQGSARLAGAASQAATPLILASPQKRKVVLRRGSFFVASPPPPPGVPLTQISRLKALLRLRRGLVVPVAASAVAQPIGIRAVQKAPLRLARSRFQKAAIFVPPPIIPPITMPRQPSQYLRVRRALPVVNPQLAIPGFIGIGPAPPPTGGWPWWLHIPSESRMG